MFKKFGFALSIITASTILYAKEIITVYSPYTPVHSGTNASRKVFDVANNLQDKYQFLLEFKPGAQGVLALKELEENANNKLAIINAAFVDNLEKGFIKEDNYIPIHSDGDACWAVVSTEGDESKGLPSIKNLKEIVVGSVGFGNATHLTALEIGKKYNIPVRFIPFKSNYDAMLSMVGGHGVNFNLERISVIQGFKEKNSNLQMLAMSCPVRHQDAPKIKTLKEYGINAPYVFNTLVAHKKMNSQKANDIARVLDQATLQIGSDEIRKLSDFRPSIFDNVSAEEFHKTRIFTVKSLRQQYRQLIDLDRK